MESNTERGDHFWNRNVVEMKFSVEHDWMKRVRFAESKPNYGMRELDPVLEELTGNKLELIGPMLDGFIQEIELSIHAKSHGTRRLIYALPNLQTSVGSGTRLWRKH